MESLNALLAGRKVLISGAGADANIGRALVEEMATSGAAVFFVGRDAAQCASLEEQMLERGLQSSGYAADLSNPSEIQALHRRLSDEGVIIDTVVNNLGLNECPIDDYEDSWKSWQRVFETNVIGPQHLTRLFCQTMIENKVSGSVLFMSSIHQWSVRSNVSYSASKGALGMMIKELAVELAPHGIRVNGIAPGYVATDKSGRPVPHCHTPLHGSSVPPEYIGRAAVYLSSAHFSKYTTGSILKLDSGLSLGNHLTFGSSPAPSLWRRAVRRLRQGTQH